MNVSVRLASDKTADIATTRKLAMLIPLLAAIAYPFLLKEFHRGIGQPGESSSVIGLGFAALCLFGAMVMPIFALVWTHRLSRADHTSPFELRARRLAYLAMAAPPLFVFTGVARGLLGRPLTDQTVWIGFWLIAAASAFLGGGSAHTAVPRPVARWRVAHGVSAALITCFVLFHLTNHLLAWFGPEVHEAVMHIGRGVYRSGFIEPVLIALLLFQIASGLGLAWRWSAQPADWYRAFQIGSGVYLAAFVITHLNSALVSARWVRGSETDWAWASGAPEGLIYDSWNIRLLPHYVFGVFFVLSHLASGLRQILIAHGVGAMIANRIWVAGLIASALGSAAIIAALIGARI
jgi:hypothetical protein